MRKFNRKRYLRNYMSKYRKQNKEKVTKANKVYYERNRMPLIEKAKKKQKEYYHRPNGHLRLVYHATKRWAKFWKLPIVTFSEFRNWSLTNSEYSNLFAVWEKNAFDVQCSPVVVRRFKKRGFVFGNMEWSMKQKHTWWSNEKKLFEEICEKIDKGEKAKQGQKHLTKAELLKIEEEKARQRGVYSIDEIRRKMIELDEERRKKNAIRHH